MRTSTRPQKRHLFALSLGFAASLFTASLADLPFEHGEGTVEDPWHVATAEQLNAVRDYPTNAFVQVNHINLGVAPWNEDGGWAPIGTEENREGGIAPFSGVYDGNGYRISSLTIDHEYAEGHWTTRPWGGLFDTIAEEGVVRNVTLDGGEIRGGEKYSAPLAGENRGLIESCHASTPVIEANEMVGGLVGDNEGTIRDSSASGSVQGGSSVGGLAGGNLGLIENSSATGDVQAEMHSVGGLVGANEGGTIFQSHASGAVSFYNVEGTDDLNGIGGLVGDHVGGGVIESSYATGDVNGVGDPERPSSRTGGLVGNNNMSEIIDSYATGNVSGQQRVGGLVGLNQGQIEMSRSSGAVSGENHVGGLVGQSFSGGIYQSYAMGEVLGADNVGGLVGELIGGADLFDSFAHGSVSGMDNVGGLVGQFAHSQLERCYSTGAVSLEAEGNAGGLIGYIMMGFWIFDSYWNTETSGWETSAGGEGRTTAQMTYPHDAGTYVDWDFDEIWAADRDGTVNSGYPYLQLFIEDAGPEPVEYEEWAVAIPDPEQRGDHDTPAGDGIPNLLKFASGLDPMTAYSSEDVMSIYVPGNESAPMESPLIEVMREPPPPSSSFAIVFYRSKTATGVQVFARHTADLVDEDFDTDEIIEELIEEDSERETWKATAPAGTRGFMRLKAVRD